jgi:hypothetical protein
LALSVAATETAIARGWQVRRYIRALENVDIPSSFGRRRRAQEACAQKLLAVALPSMLHARPTARTGQVLLCFFRNLAEPGEPGGPVGWISNGVVLAWSWMACVPYELRDEDLRPVFADNEWPRIVSDALAATLLLFERVAELGGPSVPSELCARRGQKPAPCAQACGRWRSRARHVHGATRRATRRMPPPPPVSAAEQNRRMLLARCSVLAPLIIELSCADRGCTCARVQHAAPA